MYGLLLENLRSLILEKFGEGAWKAARELAGISHHTFVIHNVYSETLIPRLVDACSEETGMSSDDIMYEVGVRFVSFVGQYGYGRILKVLGRNMRDFLNGLDNLHEYLRFSYPKLSPPSFFVSVETRDAMILHYRSKRKGYLYYVLGQIKEVGRLFYNADVELKVLSSDDIGERGCSYVIQINFDNEEFSPERMTKEKKSCLCAESLTESDGATNLKYDSPPMDCPEDLGVPAEIFFDIFPFHVLVDKSLLIRSYGSGLRNVLCDIIGVPLAKAFEIVRPNLDISWETVLMHTNVVFELMSRAETHRGNCLGAGRKHKHERIHLKGQMMHMRSWDAIIFLGTPILESLETMFNIGLYINDLSMHDSSRDLVLAGMQQSAELRLALDQEKQKSSMLEASMRRLDIEMSRTDALLYRMIPKQVADRLRKGEPALSTCETFENVTILFSDVVGFTSICSKILPMEVVRMLNEMYTKFDYLSEVHEVYKVETIGDAYMVVSGVPEPTAKHAQNVADMALAMIDVVPSIPNPSLEKQHLRTRIGIHSGTVVAGVVGIKMPRYCLFGDTVNTASRMESRGAAMSIHISQSTKNSLPSDQYRVKRRGSIPIKGKGTMQTYWLVGKTDSAGPDSPRGKLLQETTNAAHPHPSGNTVMHVKMTPNDIRVSRYKESLLASQGRIPQCPFATIFQEVYGDKTRCKIDDHLDLPSTVESCKRPGKSQGSNGVDRVSRDLTSLCPFSPREVIRTHSRKNGLNISSMEIGLGTSKEEMTSPNDPRKRVWFRRKSGSKHVIDSQAAYEELLHHRFLEDEHLKGHYTGDSNHDTYDNAQLAKESKEDILQEQLNKASLLHMFCLGGRAGNDTEYQEQAKSPKEGIPEITGSESEFQDMPCLFEEEISCSERKPLNGLLHSNNNNEESGSPQGRPHQNRNVKLSCSSDESHLGFDNSCLRTGENSCISKRNEGKCSIL